MPPMEIQRPLVSYDLSDDEDSGPPKEATPPPGAQGTKVELLVEIARLRSEIEKLNGVIRENHAVLRILIQANDEKASEIENLKVSGLQMKGELEGWKNVGLAVDEARKKPEPKEMHGDHEMMQTDEPAEVSK